MRHKKNVCLLTLGYHSSSVYEMKKRGRELPKRFYVSLL